MRSVREANFEVYRTQLSTIDCLTADDTQEVCCTVFTIPSLYECRIAEAAVLVGTLRIMCAY